MSSRPADIPVVELSEVPNLACDPERSLYAFFDRLRETAPVVRSQTDEGSWHTFLRMDTAKRILMDTDTFKTYHPDRSQAGYFEENLLPASKDPPEHERYRRLIRNVFSPRAVMALEPRMTEFAENIVDAIAPKGGCEFIEEFAQLYSGLVFMEFMRFPLDDLALVTEWDNAFWTSPDQDPGGARRRSGLESLRGYVSRQLATKRREPDQSLLGVLTTASIEGRPLSDTEIISYGVLASIGGIHTTKAMLGRMMLHLATHPEHRRQLNAEPDLARNFIDEALRIYPIGESFRFVTRDVELDGCPLSRGDRISVHWPAINRDPRAVAHPTEMDLRSPTGPLLAFGYGVHFCIGMHLARHDMEIALRTWLRRIPEFGLEPDARITERVWGGAGLHGLPLRWPA